MQSGRKTQCSCFSPEPVCKHSERQGTRMFWAKPLPANWETYANAGYGLTHSRLGGGGGFSRGPLPSPLSSPRYTLRGGGNSPEGVFAQRNPPQPAPSLFSIPLPAEDSGSTPAKRYLPGEGCRELSLRCYVRSLRWSHPQASSDPSSSVLPPAEATLLPRHRGGAERLDRVAWGFHTVVALRRQFLPSTLPFPASVLGDLAQMPPSPGSL